MATVVVLVWSQHEILLPFITGMVVGYFLDPLANRMADYRPGLIVRLAAAFCGVGMVCPEAM